ncbi:MAG TPA: hypothetical protein PLG05_06495 [Bacteroidales bacterium]|nr:hypothetical protein [Bacteroidales bacterium]HOR60413.1 hypothetical protein [Bacteroidales bacterium]HPL04807.1 hypothetical protein [Bacteroidales bacterium]
MKIYKTLILSLITLLLVSCGGEKKKTYDYSVSEINFLANYDSKELDLDYENALGGFTIPTKNQTESGYFNFNFKLTNNSSHEKEYFYKIYYQNESYKIQEYDAKNKTQQAQYVEENFYGSWEDTNIGFKSLGKIRPADHLSLTDSFRIVGNPRNEEKYFFYGENDRWKRNPRVGEYSFMLVIVDEENIMQIPEYIKHINLLKDSTNFVSPYYYFLYGEGKDIKNCFVSLEENALKVVAKPNLGGGIYVNHYMFDETKEDLGKYQSCNCNNNSMKEKAHFEQFLHYIDESSRLHNVPVIKDVLSENFTNEEYNWLSAFYEIEDRITVLPQLAQYPCETVKSDSISNKIIIRNPASTYGNWQKQNVGIIARHGFVYGKYTVKAKLTSLLNKDNVWNGITNAIWLINQKGRGNETGWNLRRSCNKNGYMKTYWGGRNDERVEKVDYSEIDFEILKTISYCSKKKKTPTKSYFKTFPDKISSWNTEMPEDIKKDEGKIAVSCTNWDMACWEPKNFSTGCHKIKYNKKTFNVHRWDKSYRAVTSKYMVPNDDVFGGDYYYFQIDWQPDKIIWRIGPEKDKLYEVGYVDNTITMVPNNQMTLIITQEFHNTNWWPGSPYEQENIPFPAKDYVGEIYEITIE